jgi:hypothetical protein
MRPLGRGESGKLNLPRLIQEIPCIFKFPKNAKNLLKIWTNLHNLIHAQPEHVGGAGVWEGTTAQVLSTNCDNELKK